MQPDFVQFGGKLFQFGHIARQHVSNIFQHLLNRDLLPFLRATHGLRYDQLIQRLPQKPLSGRGQSTAADSAYVQLWERLERAGHMYQKPENYRRSHIRQFLRLGSALAIWGIAVATGHASLIVPATILLGLAHLEFGWWVHDVGHGSFAESEPVVRRHMDWWGILVLGAPLGRFHQETHRVHHLLPNAFDVSGVAIDTAFQTRTMTWNRTVHLRLGQWAQGAWNVFFWIGVVIPFTYPLLVITLTATSYRRKEKHLRRLAIIRWLTVVSFLALAPGAGALYLMSVAIPAAWMALVSSLNHFPAPTVAGAGPGFVDHLARTTISLKQKSAMWTILTGGLNYHIEHHLFPTIPHRDLPLMESSTRDLFYRHGLPYQEQTFRVAFTGMIKCLFTAPQAESIRWPQDSAQGDDDGVGEHFG